MFYITTACLNGKPQNWLSLHPGALIIPIFENFNRNNVVIIILHFHTHSIVLYVKVLFIDIPEEYGCLAGDEIAVISSSLPVDLNVLWFSFCWHCCSSCSCQALSISNSVNTYSSTNLPIWICRLSHWTAEFLSFAIELTHDGQLAVSVIPAHAMNAAQM